MDIQNHFYGHSTALALAAGLARPRHVQGIVQHGWTVTSPVPVLAHDFPHVGVRDGWPMYVWSHSSRAWSPADEERRTVAIGSPFLYLARAAREAGWQPEQSERTAWIPFHGTRLLRVRGDHEALAREALEREGPCTVCLHVEDVQDPEIVAAWQGAGHELVTAGGRNDPLFLARVLDLVSRSPRTASNRLSTAVLYAAALGREVAVYGPPLALDGDQTRSLDHVRHTWPELHGDTTVTGESTPLAATELGVGHLLDAAALRATLGWDQRFSTRAAASYWAGSSLQKAAAVLRRWRDDASARGIQPGAVAPRAFLRHPLSHLPRPLPVRLPDPAVLAPALTVPRG